MKGLLVITGTAFLVLATANVRAQHHVEYGVNLSLGPTDYIEQYEQGSLPVGQINREDIIDGYGRVAGVANVGFGVNKARVDLSGTNPANPLFFDYGFATSRYWDVFQFDDPQLNGTHGFFDVTLYVAGTGSVTLSDAYLQSPDTEFDAFWHAVINVWVDGVTDPDGNPNQSVYYAGEWYKGFESSTLDYFGDPLDTYQRTATVEFIYGQPIFMDTFLQVDTFFDNQTSSVAGTLDTVIDLGNSSYWGGIRNLRDSQGNPVSNAGYSSSSGFDYRQTAFESMAPTVLAVGSRRLSITPQPTASGAPVALKVTSPDFPLTRYVAANGYLVQTPVFLTPAEWGTKLVRSPDIIPGTRYSVRAEDGTLATADVTVTTARFGDVAGPFQSGAWTPPDGVVDVSDMVAAIARFVGAPTAPSLGQADIHPCTPNGVLDILDIVTVIDAFGGKPFSCPAS